MYWTTLTCRLLVAKFTTIESLVCIGFKFLIFIGYVVALQLMLAVETYHVANHSLLTLNIPHFLLYINSANIRNKWE